MFSCEFSKVSEKTFFQRTTPVAASEIGMHERWKMFVEEIFVAADDIKRTYDIRYRHDIGKAFSTKIYGNSCPEFF